MAEQIWVVHRTTWHMQLMWAIDATEAVRLGDYAYAPVGGVDPPQPRQNTALTTRKSLGAGKEPPPRKAA